MKTYTVKAWYTLDNGKLETIRNLGMKARNAMLAKNQVRQSLIELAQSENKELRIYKWTTSK
jgi:hypothetical protein